jgi:hypothetical protein
VRVALCVQQVVHVVRVLLFDDQSVLEHLARTRIAVTEVADELAVVIDGDALGDQVLLDHFDQLLRRAVFRRDKAININETSSFGSVHRAFIKRPDSSECAVCRMSTTPFAYDSGFFACRANRYVAGLLVDRVGRQNDLTENLGAKRPR